jgi:putative oxidoreductase
MKCRTDCLKDYNILVLRILIGIAFIFHFGWNKISGGPEVWTQLGGVMSIFGITFLPVVWGFIAMIAEFFGAIFISAGIFTRYASAFLVLTMIVALIGMHGSDILSLNFKGFMTPFAFLMVSTSLMFSGAGKVLNLEKKLFGKEF